MAGDAVFRKLLRISPSTSRRFIAAVVGIRIGFKVSAARIILASTGYHVHDPKKGQGEGDSFALATAEQFKSTVMEVFLITFGIARPNRLIATQPTRVP